MSRPSWKRARALLGECGSLPGENLHVRHLAAWIDGDLLTETDRRGYTILYPADP